VKGIAGQQQHGAAFQPGEAGDRLRMTDVSVARLEAGRADVVLAGGFSGCRRIAALADLHGRTWSPHTWSNGYGLVVNLHLALAVSTCPFVEVPYDPPGLTAERRDWLLPQPVEIDADGTIAHPSGPGLGVELDRRALALYRLDR